MSISLEIRNGSATRTVTIEGDGAIDDTNEARRALDAAGEGAASSTYTVGGVTRSYAQIVGFMRLGSEAHRVAGVDEFFRPEGTSWDSVSNNILANAARFDNRPRSDGSAAVDATANPVPPNAPLDVSTLLTGSNALPTGSTIRSVEVSRNGTVVHNGSGSNIPATALSQEGEYRVRVFYTRPNETQILHRDIRFRVGAPAPIVVAPTETGSAYGVVPNIPANAIRPAAAPLVPGVAAPPPAPLDIGSVEVTSAVPQGSVLAVFVDGNEAGTIPLQPNSPGTDHTVRVTIPGATTDGPHQIGLRIRRTGQAEVRFNDRPVAIGPASATLNAGASNWVADSSAPVYRFRAAEVRVRVTTDRPTWVRITAGTYTADVQLTAAGENTVTFLPRAARNRTPHYVGAITVQPLSGGSGSTPVGTAITLGRPSGETHDIEIGVAGGTTHHRPRPTGPVVPPT